MRKAIENDRQSVRKAKEAWQQASGKEESKRTFGSSLSALAQDIDVYGNITVRYCLADSNILLS